APVDGPASALPAPSILGEARRGPPRPPSMVQRRLCRRPRSWGKLEGGRRGPRRWSSAGFADALDPGGSSKGAAEAPVDDLREEVRDAEGTGVGIESAARSLDVAIGHV